MDGHRTRTLYIRTLGCPKNEADSEHLRGLLEGAGYRSVPDPDDADVVIVNTCSFIDAARRESVDAVLDEVSRREDGQRVIVAGCLVERYGPELAAELGEVDAFMSLGSYGQAPAIVDAAAGGVRQERFDAGKVPIELGSRAAPSGPTAYVKISEGCDRTCTFCAIPSIRGGHRSRTPDAIEDELRWVVARGAKEVVLVAQDMSLYGRDTTGRWGLPDLLRRLGDTEGLHWLRMLYQYPRYVDDALLDAVAESRAAIPYFDLSLQHASGRLVRAMKRWGDGERFLELIAKIRDRFPDAALRSAFIVGFPGETDEDVEELAEFLAQARIDWAGFFPFSSEEGTEAGAFTEDLVAPEVAQRRAEALAFVQADIAEAERTAMIGTDVEVLVEQREGTDVVGRTWREAPEVDGSVTVRGARAVRVGDMVRARVVASDGVDLVAEVE